MYIGMYSVTLLVVGVIQQTNSRSISLFLNFSMTLKDGQNKYLPSAGIVRFCMKETQISMAELKGIGDVKEVADTENVAIDKSLHCFSNCLYRKLGLIRNDDILEPEYFQKYYKAIVQEKKPIDECMNIESSINKCETAYKLHLCYVKLESLENARRIRNDFDYNDNANDNQDEYEDKTLTNVDNNNDNDTNNDTNNDFDNDDDNDDHEHGDMTSYNATEMPRVNSIDPLQNDVEKSYEFVMY